MNSASGDTKLDIRVVGHDEDAGESEYALHHARDRGMGYFDFDSVLGAIKQVANESVEGLMAGEDAPCEVSLHFGLTLGGKGGIPSFAEISGEGSVSVDLTWRRQ